VIEFYAPVPHIASEHPARGPTPSAHPSHKILLPLTGLRFLAAFSVLVAHGASVLLGFAEVPFDTITWLKQASGFGMTLFFVLSGFVIHYNYGALVVGRGIAGKASYLWARFARLYPLYLLMLLVYVLLSSRTSALWTGHPERFKELLHSLPYFLLSVQSWVYVPVNNQDALISGIGGASPLTWSISTEWFFYFAYFLVGLFVLRLRRPWTVILAGLIWSAIWIALASTLFARSPQIDAWAVERFGPVASMTHNWQDSFVRWLLYFSPYLRIGAFVLGCLTAQLYLLLRDRDVTRVEFRIAQGVLLIALASVPVVTYLMYAPDAPKNFFRPLNLNFGLALSVAPLLFCGVRYRSVFSRVLSTRPCLALGEASYSIYLVHYVVLMIVARTSTSGYSGSSFDVAWAVAKLVAVVAVILALSLLLYANFEAPARRWLRSLPAKSATAGRMQAIVIAVSPAVLALVVIVGERSILG